MNLQEFIKFRDECPMCRRNLITKFHSNRKQAIRYEDNRAVFTLSLDSTNRKGKHYKASYSFGMTDNSIRIEFYTKDGDRFHEEAPQFLRKRFLELHNNLHKVNFRFIRECVNSSCMRYAYCSDFFDIDLRQASFQPLIVKIESVALVHTLPNSDEYRHYRMINKLVDKQTNLFFWKNNSRANSLYDPIPGSTSTNLELPLIPFVSVENTTKRLNNLIVFS